MSENQPKVIPGTNITENPDKTINMMGMQVDLSSKFGEELAKILSCQLTEEEMECLITYLKSEFFDNRYNYTTQQDEIAIKHVLRKQYSYEDGKYEPQSPIVMEAKKRFDAKIKDELNKKIDEIISSTDYQERIDIIANEIVDYSVEGYKEDMKRAIRYRMGITPTDPDLLSIGGINLRELIRGEITNFISSLPRGY